MKQILLTQGQVALVDDADYDYLNQFKWFAAKNSYGGFCAARHTPTVGGKRHTIRMHRVILDLKYGDKRQADHENHQTLDNRQHNLRICTHQQNGMNQKFRTSTTSKYKGVSWIERLKKWVVQIMVDGKKTYLGLYEDEEFAAMAYDLVARKAHGKFACLNFPMRIQK